MPSCNIIIETKEDFTKLFSRALIEGEKYNAQINGDSTCGGFKVKALGSIYKGNYSTLGNRLSITITQKPFYIPCSVIEGLIKNFLGS